VGGLVSVELCYDRHPTIDRRRIFDLVQRSRPDAELGEEEPDGLPLVVEFPNIRHAAAGQGTTATPFGASSRTTRGG
jgi:hypothetical protein